jgi:hypothetical protein
MQKSSSLLQPQPRAAGPAPAHSTRSSSRSTSRQPRVAAHAAGRKEVTLLDYGAGNVRSVRNAIKKLGFAIKDVSVRRAAAAAVAVAARGRPPTARVRTRGASTACIGSCVAGMHVLAALTSAAANTQAPKPLAHARHNRSRSRPTSPPPTSWCFRAWARLGRRWTCCSSGTTSSRSWSTSRCVCGRAGVLAALVVCQRLAQRQRLLPSCGAACADQVHAVAPPPAAWHNPPCTHTHTHTCASTRRMPLPRAGGQAVFRHLPGPAAAV